MKYKLRNIVLSKLRQKSHRMYKNKEIKKYQHRLNLIFLNKFNQQLIDIEDNRYNYLLNYIDNNNSEDIEKLANKMLELFN